MSVVCHEGEHPYYYWTDEVVQECKESIEELLKDKARLDWFEKRTPGFRARVDKLMGLVKSYET